VHAFIIEDDYLIGRSIQDMLSDLGFTAFSFARSEDTAVAGAAGERFDLITADVRLVPGDGLKAVEAIRAGRGTPVVFITGYADDLRDRLHGPLVGLPIVEKPVKAAALEAAVRAALAAGAPVPEPRNLT
jgi:DNA-binding response OmpR family regulator